MLISIRDTLFDPWQELRTYQEQNTEMTGKFGANSIFVGTMRDFNDGENIAGMTLEHYPGMTEKYIAKAIQAAEQQWTLIDSLVIHRVGKIYPNEAIVLVSVWTSHRGDAFDACRYIMETLKTSAPFWKKEFLNVQAEQQASTEPFKKNQEVTAQASRWLSSNSDGYAKKT